jgi:hypothetical protein
MKNKQLSKLIITIGILALIISGCGENHSNVNQTSDQSNQAENNGSQPAESSGNEAEEPQTNDEIERAWQNSAHADTYLVDSNGHNNSCAQCHGPINWMPSMDTIPESCFTCKFELEDPPPYIAEEEWADIPCKVCHELNKKDEVEPDYKWLAIAPIDEYEDVESTTELCQKCHFAEEPREGHLWVSVVGPHEEQTCTNCHNPHDGSASCINCHTELDFSTARISGHDPDHELIPCVVCHDGSGLAAGINAETNLWELLRESSEGNLAVSNTHNITLEALCDRCHFAGNPWELSVQP